MSNSQALETCAMALDIRVNRESSTIVFIILVSYDKSFILIVLIFKKSRSTEDWKTEIKEWYS